MIVAVALGSFVLASCDDDDTTNDIPVHGLEVVSAQTSYTAVGGTGEIRVAKPVISAYAKDPSWTTLAQNGSTVSLTVDKNNTKQSRHTTIVIKSSDVDSAVVNIDQLGSIFSTSMPLDVQAVDSAQTFSYTYQADATPTVTSSADWITTSVSDSRVIVNVAANTTGNPRTATVTMTSGINTFTSTVLQYEFDKDIAGTYYLLDGDSLAAGIMSGSVVELGTDSTGQTVLDMPNYGWSLPVTWNGANFSLTMQAATPMGTYTMRDGTLYYIFADVWATDGYIYWDNSITYTAPFVIDSETGEVTATFQDDGTISSSIQVSGICIDAFTTSSVSNDGYAGSFFNYGNPLLYKVPASDNAKSRFSTRKLTGPRRLVPRRSHKLF